MPDPFHGCVFPDHSADYVEPFRPLPPWLAKRLLRPGESVTWVRGPRFNPSWECYITHPALFLFALVFAANCWGFAWLIAKEGWEIGATISALVGTGIVLGSIFVLGLACGYFTRLVVTDYRLVVLQGYELCRSWSILHLPGSLRRYRPSPGNEEWRQTVDMDALKTMLGGSSDQFTDSKTILAFAKEIDRMKDREEKTELGIFSEEKPPDTIREPRQDRAKPS